MNAQIITDLNAAPHDPIGGKALSAALQLLGPGPFAVRSSAHAEDGHDHSFAGQFESFLNITSENVPEFIEKVRHSGCSDRIKTYTSSHEIDGSSPLSVIVQAMIPARAAGVAFGADPVTGERDVTLVSATPGLGEALVSGEVDADSWRISRNGDVLSKKLVQEDAPTLTPGELTRIVALCHSCNFLFDRPQDIEWALAPDGQLWLVQSRAITTLAGLPDPADDLIVWDNSNIAESYGGVTTPLTYSFAARIYEHVYREFCKLLGVPRWKIRKHDDVFPQMLGLVRGRVYYNLVSWYRVLALLPGFQLNRRFMEQMMGVKTAMPDEVVGKIIAQTRTSPWRDRLALIGTTFGLIRSHRRLPQQIKLFYQRLNDSLQLETPLAQLRGEELVAHYQELEKRLLQKWDAPLVNDFFAMIFYGVLGKLCSNWLHDQNGTLQNELLQDSGDIISARPPRLIKEMAELVRPHPNLARLLADQKASRSSKLRAVRDFPALQKKLTAYLDEFGDRCLEELKLESATVVDDPGPLLSSIGGFALREPAPPQEVIPPKIKLTNPFKKLLFNWVLKHTRARIRDRENLRFERTRVFGRVRQILRELGGRLATDGQLDSPDEVFHLRLDEALATFNHTAITHNLRGLVAARREEFARYHDQPAPPDRFSCRGALHRQKTFTDETQTPTETEGDFQGVGACSGIVRGPVRVVTNPREASLEPGEILVATQTDPGWVVLFPAASGLLVERGSLLSHSAIVARELQLPASSPFLTSPPPSRPATSSRWMAKPAVSPASTMKTEIQDRADFSQVRYGQCWEDADILVKALKVHEGRRCLSIGSAGDNSFALLAAGASHVTAVEMNPAQIACINLRKHAYLNLSYPEFLTRIRVRGKFERYFDLFRTRVLPLAHSRKTTAALLTPENYEERRSFYDHTWNTWRWRAIFKVFFSRFVMGRLGRDPAFFDYVEGSVADRILERARFALVDLDPSQNPYLHWILTGDYGEVLPLALQRDSFFNIRTALQEHRFEIIEGTLEQALAQSDESFDAFNLSDIFEYMSEASTESLLRSLVAHSTPGARLAYWNMLAPRSRPASMSTLLKSCEEEARQLFQQDRAFFYSRFLVEEVL